MGRVEDPEDQTSLPPQRRSPDWVNAVGFRRGYTTWNHMVCACEYSLPTRFQLTQEKPAVGFVGQRWSGTWMAEAYTPFDRDSLAARVTRLL